MRAFFLICARCDARVPIGGNEDITNPRLIAAIKAGWHHQQRQDNHCPRCWSIIQTERQPARLI